MTEEMTKGKPEDITTYADLPKYSINGGTIPGDILTTLQRPDIVIINRPEKKITLFELTVSFDKKRRRSQCQKNT